MRLLTSLLVGLLLLSSALLAQTAQRVYPVSATLIAVTDPDGKPVSLVAASQVSYFFGPDEIQLQLGTTSRYYKPAQFLRQDGSPYSATVQGAYLNWINVLQQAGQVVATNGSSGSVVVANSLTETDPTKALSAAQGGVLKGLIDGAGAATAGSVHLSNVTQFGRKKTVRIMYTGTSLANNANSGAKGFLGALYNAIGDSGNKTEQLGYLGGGYTEPVSGWKKQRYGGFGLIRLRGESTSTALSFSRFFKRYVLRYSTETTGGSFDLYVDGVKNQTINCQGTQKYSNEAVVTFDSPGQHTVEIRPPGSGFAFIESQDFCLDQSGLHVMDGSLGGSAIAQMVQVSAAQGNQAPSIAVEGTNGGFASNGIDAVYNNTSPNTRPDAVVCMYSVNDAGAGIGVVNSIYKPALNYLVQKTYENNQQLILVIDMGGHYSLPSYPTYAAFQEVRNFLLTFADRPHVTLIDWHKQSGMITSDYDELVRLGNRYYPVTGLTKANAQANTGWGGDFIHPNDLGNAILSEQLLARFGLMPTGRQGDELSAVIDALQPRTELPSTASQPAGFSDVYTKLKGLTRLDANQLGTPGRYTVVGTSINIATNRPEPLYQNPDEANYSGALNDEIGAANTSDKYGAFRKYDSANPLASYIPMHAQGGKATLTLVVGSGQFSIQIRNDANTVFLPLFVQGAEATGLGTINGTNGQATPQVMHLTLSNVPGVFYVVFTGTLYGASVSTTPFPVLAGKRTDKAPFVSIPRILTADILPAQVRHNQSYFEQANGKSIEKIATEGLVYKPLAGTANKLFPLYRLRDKTSCMNQVFRLNGAVSFGAYSETIGGMTQVSTDNPQVFAAPTAFTTALAGKTVTLVGQSGYVRIQLYNGGTNTYLGLKADGTWSNNGGNDGGAPNLLDGVTVPAGRPLAFTVTLPSTAVFNNQEWELRVYVAFNQPQPGYWHVCEGALACN